LENDLCCIAPYRSFFLSRCAALLVRYPAFSSPDTPLSAGLQAAKYNLSCKLSVGYDQNPYYFVHKSANLKHDVIYSNSSERGVDVDETSQGVT